MAKRSVLSRPLPDSSLPRNTFDRSFFKNLNWSGGMLLPVFCQFVPVGSSGQINRSIFMRTNAVNTAAFPKLDTHIDFYKVPLKLLMTRYEEFKLNLSDANSSSLISSPLVPGADTPPSSMPFFNIGTIYASYFGSGNTSVDDVGYSSKWGTRRLLDLLGYNDDYITRYGQTGSDLPNMNLQTFKLQAYQKVYYDHYRNTAYESNLPQAYNADYLYTGGTGNGEYGLNEIPYLFKLHYVNYRKDFFQNIYPALNYVVSTPNGLSWNLPSSVSGFATGGTSPESVGSSVNNGGTTYLSPTYYSSGQNYLSVQGIRAAFALDKLLRLSSYAPKHVKDQLQARFGVKVHDSSSYESQYLGSFMNDVVIGEVTATATTQTTGSGGSTINNNLGEIGGRGVGAEQRGKDINFTVTGDDGDCIIIGMMYTLARSVYDSYRLDAFNFKFTREDIFVPEFMDLGLRPITLKEIYTPSSGVLTSSILNTIVGYVPRDQEYKLGIDENHGIFRYGHDLQIFVNHTNINTYSRGLTPGTPGVNMSWFKVSPQDLDAIFAQNFDMAYQSTDQFFGHIEFKFISRQNMSVHGQPRL